VFFIGGVGLIVGLLLAAAGAFLHSEYRWRLGLFLLACIVGTSLPDSGGWFVAGASLLVLDWSECNREVAPSFKSYVGKLPACLMSLF
jgi:hypothetical protein